MFVLLEAACLLGSTGVLVAEDYYSAGTGPWNTPATWRTGSFAGPIAMMAPVSGDNVTIGNSDIITLTANAAANNVTILSGTLRYDNATALTLDITGNLRIEMSGTLTVRQVGSGLPHFLVLRGNVVNNGTLSLRPVPNSPNFRVTVVFASPSLQTITGNPTLTRFYKVYMNKGSVSSVVESTVNVGVGDPDGTNGFDFSQGIPTPTPIPGGTWRQSAGTLTFDDGCPDTAEQELEVTGAIHVVGTGNLIFGQAGSGASFTLLGGALLFNTTSSQPSRFGSMMGNSLRYKNNANISNFTLRQGTVIVAGRLARESFSSVETDALRYEQTGGTLIVTSIGAMSGGLASFELPSSSSSFLMSGGTILLRNANASPNIRRPADFWLPANSTISGGTIQFGDAQSTPMQQFNINIPQNLALSNLTVFNGVSLNPYLPSQNLRVAGNILVNGTFDGTRIHAGTTSTLGTASSTLTLQGNNATNQIVWGVGTLTLHHCTMNRQAAGAGVVQLFRTATVQGVFNLQETPSQSPQILELGPSTDLILTNPNTTAIQNAVPFATPDTPELRAIRTSSTSGRLFRALMAGGMADYLFPVSSLGSAARPQASYNPLRYEAAGGSSGQLGVRVAVGSSTAPATQGAHRQAQSGVTSFARRYWAVQASSLTGAGRIIAASPSDFAGSPDATRFSRYRPDETTPNNAWFLADTLTQRPATETEGDWTWLESPQRIFYSRASGNWTDAASWSFLSHRGAQVANGLFPSRLTDSVVVGGGASGRNNHVIALTREVSIGGIQVGAGIHTTGTLECSDDAVLGGNVFRLNDRSTLRIGSEQGIAPLLSNTGNIRTNSVRSFSPNAEYEYIGRTAQVFGDALPSSVYALGMAKPVGITLTGNRSISIAQNLTLTSGVLDIGIFTLKNTSALPNTPPQTASELASCSIGAGAILRIGGTSGFADASTGTVSNYALYRLDEQSTVEWYGTQHVIEPIPQNAALTALGSDIRATANVYGNVSLRASAFVSAWNPVLVRGSLWVRDSVRFVNYSPQFRVLGSAYNSASFLNLGVMDIGQ
ncbi:MAG: hypothetical protein EAZ92_17575 [Candidatus Kapaibacterium sp.]|nr:MAG: hypothetical protein EAZ92_17575 [Candidatus Kapabacteria bacterium]